MSETTMVRERPMSEVLADIGRRDTFAAAALTGMLHNGFIPKQFLGPKPDDGPTPLRDYATAAYAIADAMMEARSK
jgi:hypothetical protein